ncbi:MAG: hypothetical protein KJ000_25745 [Pirellulaceae bacterium]|jgi:hypothetical protein|nr:hypothetical protein [Pirellulaceae bacterium]
MKKQLNIFAVLLLSLAAGMTVSEVISYRFDRDAVTEVRLQAQVVAPVVATELPSQNRVVN